MAQAEDRTAIVFIHGVGVQDRYQQLTDFSDGLLHTPADGAARFDDPNAREKRDARPLANFVPLVATDGSVRRDVEVQEIFWGPLLNGKTNPFSVLTWVAGLLGRSTALVNDGQPTPNVTGRPGTSRAKWLYTIGYLSLLVAVAGAVFWTLLNGVALSLDQTTYFKAKTEAAMGHKPSVEHLEAVTPQSLGLLTGVDYGPGHILAPRDGKPRLPFARRDDEPFLSLKVGPLRAGSPRRDPAQDGPQVARNIELRLAPDGSLAPQVFREGAYRAEEMGQKEMINGRARAFGAFFVRSLTYLPSRDPNLPTLGFADFVGGQGVLRDIDASHFAWGVVFFVSAFAAAIFFGRAKKNERRWRERNIDLALRHRWLVRERAARNSGGLTREEEREALRLFTRGLQAWAINLGASVAFGGLAMVSGNFVSHVAAYFLGSIALLRLAYVGFGQGLANIAGDVQIYVTRNENSDKFAAREKVLETCVEGLWTVLRSDRYNDVVFAAHSLGSVVGLEAIRRMYAHLGTRPEDDPDVLAFKKLRAFVTFGSPLEKTRLYFQRDDYKSRYAEFSQEIDLRIFRTDDPARPCIRWVNYWMFDDIICDPLVTYPVDREVRLGYMTRGFGRRLPGGWPHSDYWTKPRFVGDMARLVLEKGTFAEPATRYRLVARSTEEDRSLALALETALERALDGRGCTIFREATVPVDGTLFAWVVGAPPLPGAVSAVPGLAGRLSQSLDRLDRGDSAEEEIVVGAPPRPRISGKIDAWLRAFVASFKDGYGLQPEDLVVQEETVGMRSARIVIQRVGEDEDRPEAPAPESSSTPPWKLVAAATLVGFGLWWRRRD